MALFIETHHSPDDDGYYAEVYDTSDRTVHTTGVYETRDACRQAGVTWISDQRAMSKENAQ